MFLYRLALLCAAGAAAVLLAACDPGATGEAGDTAASAGVTYSCCADTDVDSPYYPGQVVSVLWTVESTNGPATGAAAQVELSASLTGPYATVGQLKSAPEDSTNAAEYVTFTAPPVRPSGTPGEKPVSTILISSDAGPGYYNLTTAMKQGGQTVGGASIIRVVTPAARHPA
ncbi:hypothetical protein FB565_003393 [Actinoplanes lutulentus]|nr:hypothetical protein [Actinoplanes lutulentus]MBB2943664.1 hypothetical protein [Actinoplanes lutulentus]